MGSYEKQQSKNGRKGGLTTKTRHGTSHYSKAGKKGAEVLWSKKRKKK